MAQEEVSIELDIPDFLRLTAQERRDAWQAFDLTYGFNSPLFGARQKGVDNAVDSRSSVSD